MSAAVATRNSPHVNHNNTGPNANTNNANTIMAPQSKGLKNEDKAKTNSPSRSSRTSTSTSPKQEPTDLAKTKPIKQELKANADAHDTNQTRPLAPPPRPTHTEQSGSDYFAPSHKNHLSSEPNPFEQSFGKPSVETPGTGALLPPLASLTSPAPLGTGGASLTGGFGWGGSLRSGPLSPAMLSGPQGDYFDSIRSYPTPNESSLRTGLTPGGGGSMFPAPSPGTQALFNSFTSGGATPSGLEFQRATLNATSAAKPDPSAITSAPGLRGQTATMNAPNLAHSDNEAANGLFMLAQASGVPASNGQYQNGNVTQPHVKNNGSISATSQAQDDVSDDNKANTRKSKRASAGKNNRRKTDDSPAKPPAAKKSKSNNGHPVPAPMSASPDMDDMNEMDEDDMDMDDTGPKDTKKMTDEEKRKNFLERNRVAALKCRQRKKQWLANLQNKVELFSSENDALNAQVSALRDEVLNLKTILIAHKDCPIAQQQSTSGSYIAQQHGVDYGNAPYGMSMQQQQQQQQQAVGMSGRRFS